MHRLSALASTLVLIVACGGSDDAKTGEDSTTQCLAACSKATGDCKASCEQACRSGNCTVVKDFPWSSVEQVLCQRIDGVPTVSFQASSQGQTCRAQ